MESLIPLLSKAYKQIGHDVVFLPHPSNRSLSHLEDGILDAEIARLSVVEKKIGNIVRINIPIHTLKGFAYTNRGEIEEYTPEILGHYRLTSLRGVLWSDRVVTNHPRSNQMTQPADLLRLLQEGRTDIIFLAEETMDRLLENHPATSVKIRKLYPAIAIQPMYHYIHKKHRDLVPELEKAISDLLKNRK
ncbi:transporter substrate-binding domain-containing protein [Kiloniella sp. b19]|uniref:transporter substrate-binding domain-containing protein n=1 Tax=Kiloniella sp. GXU_MW_B19 TaxID=3141326 RepID=UPI0031CF4308